MKTKSRENKIINVQNNARDIFDKHITHEEAEEYIDGKWKTLKDYLNIQAGKILYANTQIEKAVKNGEMVGLPKRVERFKPLHLRSPQTQTK